MKKSWVLIAILCLGMVLSACDGTPSTKELDEQHQSFLEKAEEIEQYSKTYYEPAQTQVDLNQQSGEVYRKWDALLNEVYQYLKTTMDADAFATLEAEEAAWIQTKESAIEAAGAEWEGGSGEPLARNAAGIQYTRERCYYLISLVKGK